MRRELMAFVALAAGLAAQNTTPKSGDAGVLLDRVAVVVAGTAITETEILDEIRVTALLNHDPLDFSPAARRKAAERLVDQELIRRDMKASKYPEPENSESDKMLAELKRTEFAGPGAYQAALRKYGVTENELKRHLLWQLAALRFTDYRFRANAPKPGEVLREHLEARADQRAASRAAAAPRTDDAPQALPPAVDQQLERWLEQARSQTRVRFKEEVFQ